MAKDQARKSRRHDWKRARRLYERDGKTFTEIGEIIGARRTTVSAHAHREGWRRSDISRDAVALATERVAAQVAAEVAPAIISTIQEAERQRELGLSINRALLEGLQRSVTGDGGERAPTLVFGPGSSPDLVLRRCFLNLGAVVGRPDGGDESSDGRGDEDSGADEAAVRAALAEAEGEEPRRGSGRSQGKVPD